MDQLHREAENILLDQIFFTVNEVVFNKLVLLFDEPLPKTDKLRQLLRAKAPWGK